MNMTINIASLKARLSYFLQQVKKGNKLIVTDRRVPIATITSINEETLFSIKPMASFQEALKRKPPPSNVDIVVDSLTVLLEDRGKR